jgi:hypothetical protein
LFIIKKMRTKICLLLLYISCFVNAQLISPLDGIIKNINKDNFFVKNIPQDEQSVTIQSIQPDTIDQVSITFIVKPGAKVFINWGVGSTVQITADGNDKSVTSSYATIDTTYAITVYGDLSKITKFFIANETTVTGSIEQIKKFTGLTYLHLYSLKTTWTGTINNLPSTLEYLQLYNLGTSLTGSINNLPIGLKQLYLGTIGNNLTGSINNLPLGLLTLTLNSLGTNLTGSIDNLPSGLTYISIEGAGTNLTGSIDNLPSGLTNLTLNGLKTNITGNAKNLPVGLIYIYFNDLSNVVGDFDSLPNGLKTLYLLTTNFTGSTDSLPSGLTFLYLASSGASITGNINNLPTGLTYLRLANLGIFTGSIDNLPTGLTHLDLSNIGTNLTGNIANLPSGLLTLILNNISTTLSGSIDDLPTELTSLSLVNLGNTLTGYVENLPGTLSATLYLVAIGTGIDYNYETPPAWGTVTITIQTALTTSMVDNFLINWAPVAGTGTKTVNLTGTNQPRTSDDPDVISAIAILATKGKTVLTN